MSHHYFSPSLWCVETPNGDQPVWWFKSREDVMASIKKTFSKVMDQIEIKETPTKIKVFRYGAIQVYAVEMPYIHIEDGPTHF